MGGTPTVAIVARLLFSFVLLLPCGSCAPAVPTKFFTSTLYLNLTMASPWRHRCSASAARLQLDPDLFDATDDYCHGDISIRDENSFVLTSSAFRSDGVTVGCDFLRMQGVTISRGQVLSSTIDVHEIIGRGAFSTVRRAVWKRIRSDATTTQTSQPTESTRHSQSQSNNKTSETSSSGSVDVLNVAIKEWAVSDADTSLHASRHRQMLLQELRALGTISSRSPALVQLHGAFLQQQRSSPLSSVAAVTVVLEYMDRGSLQDYLEQRRSNVGLGEPLTAAILYQMLTGLAALHAPDCGLLHRDLKPANVLIHSNGAVKLCDFGLATSTSVTCSSRSNAHSATTPFYIDGTCTGRQDETLLHRTVIGTTQYMAPERLRARPYGRSSDVWSLGLIVWQCITGQTQPFLNENNENVAPQHVQSQGTRAFSMVDLLVTIEEMTVADLVHAFCQTAKGKDNITSSSSTISAGLQEILSGCLQVEPGTVQNCRCESLPAHCLTQCNTLFPQPNGCQRVYCCIRLGFHETTTSNPSNAQ
jgi:serine/threonine protein kinase